MPTMPSENRGVKVEAIVRANAIALTLFAAASENRGVKVEAIVSRDCAHASY